MSLLFILMNFQSILCKLGFHKWGVKVHDEIQGSFKKNSEQTCQYCSATKKSSEPEDWDKE